MLRINNLNGFGGSVIVAPYVAGIDGVFGFTSVTIPIPSGLIADDIILIFIETTNGSTVATPSGYTLAGTGTDGSSTQIHVFWKRATGSESGFTQTNSDHQSASVILVRGAAKSGTPYEAFAAGSISSTASPAIPGVTTLGLDRLVLQSIARGNDVVGDQFSSPANSTMYLTTLVDERGSNPGNGGGVAVISGIMQAAGASGSTTLTNAGGSMSYAYASFAMKPIS